MTTQINLKDEFRHISMAQLRQILISWETKGNLTSIGSHSKVKMSGPWVLAILHEALQEGLLQPFNADEFHTTHGLSEAGEAIAKATARKRSPKETGAKILASIIENAEKLNSHPQAVVRVNKIWVFGSFIDPTKNDIGDLDIALEYSQTALFHGNALRKQYYDEHFPELKMGNVQPFWLMPHKFLQRSLYGSTRSPLISEAQVLELIELHAPCALAYEHNVGAIQPLQPIPHHPSSMGRTENVGERLSIPVLGAMQQEFSPTAATILTRHARSLWGRYVEIQTQSLPKRLAAKVSPAPTLDPEQRFAITFRSSDDTFKPYFALIERSADTTHERWNYDFRISMQTVENARVKFDKNDQFALGEIVKMMVGADMFRLACLRRDLDPTAQISMNIHVNADNKTFPKLWAEVQTEAQANIFYDEDLVPAGLLYGISIHDEEQSGYSTPHVFELDDHELNDLPSDFPLSKEAIKAHPSYASWQAGEGAISL